MKLTDAIGFAIGISLVCIGIVMTVLLYRATFGPSVEVRDFKIQEIPSDHKKLPDNPLHERIRFEL